MILKIYFNLWSSGYTILIIFFFVLFLSFFLTWDHRGKIVKTVNFLFGTTPEVNTTNTRFVAEKDSATKPSCLVEQILTRYWQVLRQCEEQERF